MLHSKLRRSEEWLLLGACVFLLHAQAMPVPAYASEQEYRRIFDSIDALILPGGEAAVDSADAAFFRASRLFFNWAMEVRQLKRAGLLGVAARFAHSHIEHLAQFGSWECGTFSLCFCFCTLSSCLGITRSSHKNLRL